jgi:hypothetical protein
LPLNAGGGQYIDLDGTLRVYAFSQLAFSPACASGESVLVCLPRHEIERVKRGCTAPCSAVLCIYLDKFHI